MKSIKGIIFDLDGVIVFTDQYHYQAWKKLADRLGAYFDEKINDRLRTAPRYLRRGRRRPCRDRRGQGRRNAGGGNRPCREL